MFKAVCECVLVWNLLPPCDRFASKNNLASTHADNANTHIRTYVLKRNKTPAGLCRQMRTFS